MTTLLALITGISAALLLLWLYLRIKIRKKNSTDISNELTFKRTMDKVYSPYKVSGISDDGLDEHRNPAIKTKHKVVELLGRIRTAGYMGFVAVVDCSTMQSGPGFNKLFFGIRLATLLETSTSAKNILITGAECNDILAVMDYAIEKMENSKIFTSSKKTIFSDVTIDHEHFEHLRLQLNTHGHELIAI